MEQTKDFFEKLYANFNARNIDAVIAFMTNDIQWANGMEGGYVYGQAAVRDYWTRQFALLSSQVTPLKIEIGDSTVKVMVHQVVHDLGGKMLSDETVYHYFHLRDDKIARFDIGERIKN
jgi:hypothetical protein